MLIWTIWLCLVIWWNLEGNVQAGSVCDWSDVVRSVHFIQFDCTIGCSFWFCASKRSVKDGCDVNTVFSHYPSCLFLICSRPLESLTFYLPEAHWSIISSSSRSMLESICKPYNNTYSFLYQRFFLFPIMGMRGCTLGLGHNFFQYICNCLNWSMNLWESSMRLYQSSSAPPFPPFLCFVTLPIKEQRCYPMFWYSYFDTHLFILQYSTAIQQYNN